jgi:hypothetical protein
MPLYFHITPYSLYCLTATGESRWNVLLPLMSLNTKSAYTVRSSAYKRDISCIALKWLEEFWVFGIRFLFLLLLSGNCSNNMAACTSSCVVECEMYTRI